MLNENNIQALLVDDLINRRPESFELITLEARYAATRRRADLLAIDKKSMLHAIEIKSDLDSLKNLKSQLEDYSKTFDFVSVATTERFINKVKNQVSNSVGLLLVSANGIHSVRAPKRYKAFRKINFVEMCRMAQLAEAMNTSIGCRRRSDLERLALNKLSLETLKALAIDSIKQRFLLQYQTFILESPRQINEEDVLLLKGVFGKRLSAA